MAQQQQQNRPQQPATPQPAKTPGSPPEQLVLREQEKIAHKDLPRVQSADEKANVTQVLVDANVVQRGQGQRNASSFGPRQAIDTDARDYLTSNGWETVGGESSNLWRDPLSSTTQRAERMQVPVIGTEDGLLPQREGPPIALMQHVAPPARWDLATEQAVAIQRMRDAALTPSAPTPLERLDSLSSKVTKLETCLNRATTELQYILHRPIPDKDAAGRDELIHVRKLVQGILAGAKRGETATTAA